MIMNFDYIKQKTVFIVDVDGTLYSMEKMHKTMAKKLFSYYLVHPLKLKELYALYYFRKLRDSEDFKSLSVDECMELTAKKLNMKTSAAKELINYRMFEYPLDIIFECRFGGVIAFLKEMKKSGKKVFVYSDYPAYEKVQKLGLEYDRIFTSDDGGINERKPSLNAMEYILSNACAPAKDCVYIGDREELDGKSAELVNIDYCDVKALIALIGG